VALSFVAGRSGQRAALLGVLSVFRGLLHGVSFDCLFIITLEWDLKVNRLIGENCVLMSDAAYGVVPFLPRLRRSSFRVTSHSAVSVRKRATVERVQQYRQNAEQCRQLASGAQGLEREGLLQIAQTWERLAQRRIEFLEGGRSE
jgi:hypothetical protein